MVEQAFFLGMGIKPSYTLESLAETVQIFGDSHRDIVRGVGSAKGLPQLTEVCTMSAMEYVDGRWTYLRPYIEAIIDHEYADDYDLKNVKELHYSVADEMVKAVEMYKSVDLNLHIDCHLSSKITTE